MSLAAVAAPLAAVLMVSGLGMGSGAWLMPANLGVGVLERGETQPIEAMTGYLPMCFNANWPFQLYLRLLAWTPGDAVTLLAQNVNGTFVEATTEGTPPTASVIYVSYTSCPERVWVLATDVDSQVVFELDAQD